MAAATILTFAVMSVAAVTAASNRASKPNVIILFADDFVSVDNSLAWSMRVHTLLLAVSSLPPLPHPSSPTFFPSGMGRCRPQQP